jgi:hypothetical protein
MTPEAFVDRLKAALPRGLRSVVLYGSAAAGDHRAGQSDYNILIVADRLGIGELDALARPAAAWARAGNRAPFLFTPEQLAGSADSFAIEILDMKQARQVLLGDDPLAAIEVKPEHVRLELERELHGKLLALREACLLSAGSTRSRLRVLTGSLTTFLVLCRAALRLYQDDVPANKIEALRALAAHAGFDPQVFFTVSDLRERRLRPREVSVDALVQTYLTTIEQLVDTIDKRVCTGS